MSKQKHTPTDEETEANAEFIILARNAHYDLLEAAKLAVQNFERRNASSADCDFMGDDDHEAWNSLRAAIAKAEGAK